MNLFDIFSIATMVISAASCIAAVTPTPVDDNIVKKLYKVIDFLAINFGYAKDKGV